MLVSPLSHSLTFVSSLGCKALCIVMNVLVRWRICLNFSLVHFKNDPEYLTKGTAQVFISLMRSLQQGLVSRSFLVVLLSFSFIFICLLVFVSNISNFISDVQKPKQLLVIFSPEEFSFFPDLLVLSLQHYYYYYCTICKFFHQC